MTTPGDACVLGIDFGTLSGRVVVVRVRDGAELGTAVHEYRHGVMDATLAATGEPLPPDWALQDPEDYRDVLREAVPAALAAAVPASAARRAAPRLPEAVEASRGAASGGPDQRARPRTARAVDRPLRRGDLVRGGVRQGAATAPGGGGGLPADP